MYLTSESPRVDDKLHLFRLTQHTFILDCYFYVCTTCLGLYLGYTQEWQYKTLTKEDTRRILVFFNTNKFGHGEVFG
jgi:predicted nucleic acid binding AN1-type Zn finger protein